MRIARYIQRSCWKRSIIMLLRLYFQFHFDCITKSQKYCNKPWNKATRALQHVYREFKNDKQDSLQKWSISTFWNFELENDFFVAGWKSGKYQIRTSWKTTNVWKFIDWMRENKFSLVDIIFELKKLRISSIITWVLWIHQTQVQKKILTSAILPVRPT